MCYGYNHAENEHQKSMFEKANPEMRTTYAMMETQGLQFLFLEKVP